MNPVTHFLISWNVAGLCDFKKRDAVLVTTGGIIADLDGFGAIVDLLSSISNNALSKSVDFLSASPLYAKYHHILCHNLTFCTICLIFVVIMAHRKLLTAALFALTFHLHLLCDILGSGGGDGYRWPIPYLYPFSMTPQLEWSGQWELASWQNAAITLLFIGSTFFLVRKKGHSPIGWISQKADKAFVETLRNRFPLSDKVTQVENAAEQDD